MNRNAEKTAAAYFAGLDADERAAAIEYVNNEEESVQLVENVNWADAPPIPAREAARSVNVSPECKIAPHG